MGDLSLDLRKRLVEAYRSKRSGTYEKTAALFRVGEATVSRLLRRYRETGDVQGKRRGGNNPRRVDLDWLRAHLEAHPDVRVVDRIEDWIRQGGMSVGKTAMLDAIHACGFTHKKRQWLPESVTDHRFKRNAKPLRQNNRS
jgi:transposase